MARDKRYARDYYCTPEGRASYLRSAAKRRLPGGVFSTDWLAEKIRAGRCEVTGLPFDLSRPVRDRGIRNPLAPSVDRIDSSRGYEAENVQVVVLAFNLFKEKMTTVEAISLIKRMADSLESLPV